MQITFNCISVEQVIKLMKVVDPDGYGIFVENIRRPIKAAKRQPTNRKRAKVRANGGKVK
jgi:hypothetical protein